MYYAQSGESNRGRWEKILLRIKELEMSAPAAIRFNTAVVGEPPSWNFREVPSTGQKATGVLLLESSAAVTVDQPEDDPVNRFITDGILPRMRYEKRRRQLIFSTHNANIPALGDAELIVGLSAAGAAEDARPRGIRDTATEVWILIDE